MATARQVATAEKLYGAVRNLTLQAVQVSASITQLTNFFDTLTPGDKTTILDILVARGHTQSEIVAFINQLKATRDGINTVIVNKDFDAAF